MTINLPDPVATCNEDSTARAPAKPAASPAVRGGVEAQPQLETGVTLICHLLHTHTHTHTPQTNYVT